MELLAGHPFYILRIPRPLEVSVLNPLIKEQISVSFPYEPLDAVTSPAAEEEQGAFFERIHAKLELYQFGQTVDPEPKVSIAALSSYQDNVGYPQLFIILIFPGDVYFYKHLDSKDEDNCFI